MNQETRGDLNTRMQSLPKRIEGGGREERRWGREEGEGGEVENVGRKLCREGWRKGQD